MSRQRPHIIHVMHELGPGGTERLVYELAARLPQRGFDVQTVTVLGSGELHALFTEESLPVTILKRKGLFGIGTVIDLIKLCRRERPDIVHTHLFLADTWGRIAALLAGVPHLVSTEHNVNPTYGFLKRSMNWVLSSVTDAHIAVSSEAKRVLAKQDRVSPKKVQVIVNGVDLGRVLPRGTRPFHDVPKLITVGRLAPQKDHATLLKALALVKRPWRLRIVGAGPLEGQLRALAERLHIAARIEWLGVREDVPSLLAESDLFCFPSRYEGLGLAVIEAAAAGVPVCTSDLPPLREIFGKTDVTFVPAGDVTSWVAAINSILNDPADAILHAARAVPTIHARFSIDRMVDQYASLYKKILKK